MTGTALDTAAPDTAAVSAEIEGMLGLAVTGRDVFLARQVPAPSTVEVFQGGRRVTSVTVPPFLCRISQTPADAAWCSSSQARQAAASGNNNSGSSAGMHLCQHGGAAPSSSF